MRKRYFGDEMIAQEYTRDASNLLAMVKHDMKLNNLRQLSRRVVLANGVILSVSSVFGQDEIQVYAPPVTGGQLDTARARPVQKYHELYLIQALGYKIHQISTDDGSVLRSTSPVPGTYPHYNIVHARSADKLYVAGDTDLPWRTTIASYDRKKLAPLTEIELPDQTYPWFGTVAATPSGGTVYALGQNPLAIWAIDTATDAASAVVLGNYSDHFDTPNSIVVHPNGEWIYVWGEGGPLHGPYYCEVRRYLPDGTLAAANNSFPDNWTGEVSVSPDGALVYVCSHTATYVLDADTLEEVAQFSDFTSAGGGFTNATSHLVDTGAYLMGLTDIGKIAERRDRDTYALQRRTGLPVNDDFTSGPKLAYPKDYSVFYFADVFSNVLEIYNGYHGPWAVKIAPDTGVTPMWGTPDITEYGFVGQNPLCVADLEFRRGVPPGRPSP